MKLQGKFPNNVPGILDIGIFPDFSMNILRMSHALFKVDQKIQQWIRLFLIFAECH